MRARVVVTLKTGILDPQGKAIEGALRALGIDGIRSVRQGKLFDIEVEADDAKAAQRALAQACDRLLANTVVENYRIEPLADVSAKVDADDVAPDEPVESAA